VGIEATGHTHWFEAMLAELGHELWGGDAARIRASVIRKQKTDARDAEHLLNLLPQGFGYAQGRLWGTCFAQDGTRRSDWILGKSPPKQNRLDWGPLGVPIPLELCNVAVAHGTFLLQVIPYSLRRCQRLA